ncbi:MAG: hypothetical protein KatS3mg127_0324 [Silanimonas sp.]|nr:MAG: hypothetical protein KatS3mg127_0324 [Silanimonas sp.]
MRPWLRWLRRLFLLGLSLGLLGLAAAAAVLWTVWPQLPDVSELRRVELQLPLIVQSADGKLIALFGETRRYPASIDQIPERVKQAFLAAEDARFYEHEGLDVQGILRAVWLLVSTDRARVPGGSTITQQVARDFYLSNEYSFVRKFREMLLAIKMERELSKDEILELYLNKIFFGNRAYGVAAAAEFYYGKTLDQLSLAEAAMLAGIPKFPSSANPISNPARAMERRNHYVLPRMHELGMISAEELAAALAEPNTASPNEPKVEVDAPYLAEMVRQAMEERFGADALTRGYRVTTTVRSSDQNAAVAALRAGLFEYDQRRGWRGPEGHIEHAASLPADQLALQVGSYVALPELRAAVVLETGPQGARLLTARDGEVSLPAAGTRWTGRSPAQLLKPGDVVRLRTLADGTLVLAQAPQAQAALVSLEHETGAVRALVGGYSFALNKFNRATQAQRQPGSSFKPFVFAAAFERGYHPASIVMDAPVVLRDRAGNVWRPQNDKGDFAGPMRLREAMVQSRNLVSVRLLDAIGVQFAQRYITQFGFSPESLPPNLSMSLGTSSLTPMAMTAAYAVFANGGYRVEPYFIARIEDRYRPGAGRGPPAPRLPGLRRRGRRSGRPAGGGGRFRLRRGAAPAGGGRRRGLHRPPAAGAGRTRPPGHRRPHRLHGALDAARRGAARHRRGGALDRPRGHRRQDRLHQRIPRRLVRRHGRRPRHHRLGGARRLRQPRARRVWRPRRPADLDRVHGRGAEGRAGGPPATAGRPGDGDHRPGHRRPAPPRHAGGHGGLREGRGLRPHAGRRPRQRDAGVRGTGLRHLLISSRDAPAPQAPDLETALRLNTKPRVTAGLRPSLRPAVPAGPGAAGNTAFSACRRARSRAGWHRCRSAAGGRSWLPDRPAAPASG